jgi:hypothetical protein
VEEFCLLGYDVQYLESQPTLQRNNVASIFRVKGDQARNQCESRWQRATLSPDFTCYPEDGGDPFFQNVGLFSVGYIPYTAFMFSNEVEQILRISYNIRIIIYCQDMKHGSLFKGVMKL